MAKAKGDGPRADDPTTATNKTALQIEQLKQQRQKEKDQADIQLKQQELVMNDNHKKIEIQSRERIEVMKIQAKQADDAAKAQQTNQKGMFEREKHQADMVGKQAEMRANAQKMQMAQEAAIAKQGDMAARASERQAAMAARQPPPQGPVL
jgi:hypothetical protein